MAREEPGGVVAGEAARLGGRDRRRIHHHQAERGEQQRRPGERAVVLRVAARCARRRRCWLTPAALAPRPRRPRRGARSRGTCRSSRTRARAAPRRRAAPARRALAPPPRASAQRSSHAGERLLDAAAHRGRSAAPRARIAPTGAAQRREVLALAVAAGDQHDRLCQALAARRSSRRRWCPSNRRTNRTPPRVATSSSRCGKPAKVAQRRRQRVAAARPTARASAQRRERVGDVVQPVDRQRVGVDAATSSPARASVVRRARPHSSRAAARRGRR